MNGQSYAPYTGILKEEAGETISCVGQIGKEGMKETDKEILRIILERVWFYDKVKKNGIFSCWKKDIIALVLW